MHPIVKRALVYTVTDIGQITAADRSELEAAVRKGWLSKGRGGSFPVLKTVYARPRFDFMAERALYVREALLHFANLAPQRRSETKLSNSPQSDLPLSKD